MGLFPRVIFQKIAPSVCFQNLAVVRFAGCGLKNAPVGPSPLALAPWQATQFCVKMDSPALMDWAFIGIGFLCLDAECGAFQCENIPGFGNMVDLGMAPSVSMAAQAAEIRGTLEDLKNIGAISIKILTSRSKPTPQTDIVQPDG